VSTAAAGTMDGPVPMRTRLLYGAGAIAYGIKDNGFSVFLLLYYNQIVGLDAGLVGLTLLVALLLDALIDPAVGHLSDRTRSRWGRRHPWLYISALPIFGCWLALWMPPEGSETFQLLWLLIFATLVRMSLSLNEVPSIALAPEMTEDYHERTSILGLRYLFGWAGGLTILAAAYGFFRLADPDVVTAADFRAYAVAGAIVMLVSVLISAIGTHRRYARPSAAGMHQPSLRDMAACLKFKPFLILLLAALFGFANQGVTFSLSSFLLAYVWKMNSAEQVLYSGCLFFGVIFALWLAQRMGMIYGKRGTAMRLALITGIIGVTPYCLLLVGLWPEPGTAASLWTYLPIVTLSTGTGIATMVTGASLMADVTTAHSKISGKQQEGVFFAGHFFMQKCVTGVGIFVAGQILVLIAFPRQANPATIDPQVVTDLATVYVVVTIALAAATAWAFSRFPLSADAGAEKDDRGLAFAAE
jgi:glycoside/pentoside/hexuronide:cation symporter, GPH family